MDWRRKFKWMLPDAPVQYMTTFYNYRERFRVIGSITNRKKNNEKNIHWGKRQEIGAFVQKSTRKPSAKQQIGVSATDLLHFHPYKATTVHKVYDTNHEDGVNFVG